MSIRLMSLVWDETDFKGTTLLCLLTLADHANDDGICWPSYERIAKRARCDRRQAMRCVEKLKAAGLVEIVSKRPTDKGQFVNVYRVRVQKGGGKMSPVGGDKNGQGGDKIGKKVVVGMSPKSSGESPIEEGPWGLSDQGNLSIQQAHEHLLASTSLNEIDAIRCCERWRGATKDFANWKESLSAFAEGFRP